MSVESLEEIKLLFLGRSDFENQELSILLAFLSRPVYQDSNEKSN